MNRVIIALTIVILLTFSVQAVQKSRIHSPKYISGSFKAFVPRTHAGYRLIQTSAGLIRVRDLAWNWTGPRYRDGNIYKREIRK